MFTVMTVVGVVALGLVAAAGWALARLPELLAPGRARPSGPVSRQRRGRGPVVPGPGPAGGCRHGLGPEVCVFCGTREHPLGRWHHVATNPATGRRVLVPTVEVPAGWWPETGDETNETETEGGAR